MNPKYKKKKKIQIICINRPQLIKDLKVKVSFLQNDYELIRGKNRKL